jgi:hypothetical protein
MTLPGGFEPPDLHRTLVEGLQANGVNAELQKVLRGAYDALLAKHGIILHYAERDRMFARVMTSVLEGMLRPGQPPAKG